jgi:glycosyltransferase involved in cell wall biosynthesis
MPDLSILIPARNEMFLKNTIDDILQHMEGDTEIIAVCDGNWPDPPIEDHPKVTLIYHSVSIGQRAATNEAAKYSKAKFIAKCDAHCAFDQGFDVKLMKTFEYNWTVVPRMFNLHVFDWKCQECDFTQYQGPKPPKCPKCDKETEFQRQIVWKPRRNCRSDCMLFDSELHFQYWKEFERRPEYKASEDFTPSMSMLGAFWMMYRERYWDIDGLDEAHGSWGQMGTELACKTWLSGGQLLTNKKTWYSHLFRTQPGFGFPYPNPGISTARRRSRELWYGNNWPKAKHPLSWLIDKFDPIPGWEDKSKLEKSDKKNDIVEVKDAREAEGPKEDTKIGTKGIVYYTDNFCDDDIMSFAKKQIDKVCKDFEIISVSLQPMAWHKNIILDADPGNLTLFRQILAGLEASTAETIFFCEHDVIYHPSHFDFTPPKNDVYYYNENTWKVDWTTGQALFYYTKQLSGLCASRDLLLQHYQKRVARVEKEGFRRYNGYEPGTHGIPRGYCDFKAERRMSEFPNLDIRHDKNMVETRWEKEQFRYASSIKGWEKSDSVPGWGTTKNCLQQMLSILI